MAICFSRSLRQIVLPALSGVLILNACYAQNATSNLDYIDPRIGNVGQLLEPTRPTVHLPNQMIRIYPKRADYIDDQISSFPLNMVSHRLGEVFAIKPGSKPVEAGSWDKKRP